MEPSVRAQYTSDVRAAVATAVGAAPAGMRDLGGFESFVHEVEIEGRTRIVKATWGGRRTPEEMGAELHFTSYLADAGAAVCRPVALAGGELQCAVPSAGGVFHVTCWTQVPGRSLRRDELVPAVFHPWGALLGRLHRLSAAYPGPPAPFARPSWKSEAEGLTVHMVDEPEIRSRFLALVAELDALPRSRETFGAMHTDPHHGNVFWHAGRPWAIDFEDMVDFWFVADLAIVLFYAVMSPPPGADRQVLYDAFAGPLWQGYATEHTLPEEARAALPLFLSLREHELRAVVLRSIPAAERSPGWVAFLEESKQRILAGEPALGLRA